MGRAVQLLIAISWAIALILKAEPLPSPHASPYARWRNGPSPDPSYFPIAVWLQNPANAERYKAAGINLYVGLWRGPTEAQLTTLQKAGMQLICSQNRIGLSNINHPVIVGWMHGDEPDNAQSRGEGRGYGPPILPETIVRDYQRIRSNDLSRPVLLNLGQGVAWDNYIGRGVRRNHPEDYAEYVKGCDMASFDIYPVVHENGDVAGKLEFVARGVERLNEWTQQAKPVWNCIECTHISNPKAKATPQQVRAEVWMCLIHGSRGLIYFVHEFKPSFKEAALLDDPEMFTAVTAINQEIRRLAPVLNSPLASTATVTSSSPEVPVALMARRHDDSTWLFAVGMRNQPTKGSFKVPDLPQKARVEVLDESRTIPIQNGEFSDYFKPYEVHLYRIQSPEHGRSSTK